MKKYSTCPKCSEHRKKKTLKCFEFRGSFAKCHHCGFYSYDLDAILQWFWAGTRQGDLM